MATPYEKVYKRFLNSIRDFEIIDLDDNTFQDMLLEWLNSACVNMRKIQNDLSVRDDELQEFEADLTELEVELLALGMKREWVSQRLNSTELTAMFLGGKEEKFYSQSNQIAQLREMKKDIEVEMKNLRRDYTYFDNNTYISD